MNIVAVESSLSEHQRRDLRNFAIQGYPREVCGVIYEHGIIVQYRNVSDDPEHSYDAEFDVGMGGMKKMWHSHPHGPNTPSDNDLQFIEHCEVNGYHFRHIIVTLKGVFEYEAETKVGKLAS